MCKCVFAAGKGAFQALLRLAFSGVSAGYKNLNAADTFCN